MRCSASSTAGFWLVTLIVMSCLLLRSVVTGESPTRAGAAQFVRARDQAAPAVGVDRSDVGRQDGLDAVDDRNIEIQEGLEVAPIELVGAHHLDQRAGVRALDLGGHLGQL